MAETAGALCVRRGGRAESGAATNSGAAEGHARAREWRTLSCYLRIHALDELERPREA